MREAKLGKCYLSHGPESLLSNRYSVRRVPTETYLERRVSREKRHSLCLPMGIHELKGMRA